MATNFNSHLVNSMNVVYDTKHYSSLSIFVSHYTATSTVCSEVKWVIFTEIQIFLRLIITFWLGDC